MFSLRAWLLGSLESRNLTVSRDLVLICYPGRVQQRHKLKGNKIARSQVTETNLQRDAGLNLRNKNNSGYLLVYTTKIFGREIGTKLSPDSNSKAQSGYKIKNKDDKLEQTDRPTLQIPTLPPSPPSPNMTRLFLPASIPVSRWRPTLINKRANRI